MQTRYSVQLVYGVFALCTVPSSILTGQVAPEVCQALKEQRHLASRLEMPAEHILDVLKLPRIEDARC
jgi:hypothetical protein